MATTKKKTGKKKMGRKPRYNPRMHPRRAAELVEQGLTDNELAGIASVNKVGKHQGMAVRKRLLRIVTIQSFGGRW